jgi:hypothetical protein
VTISGAATGWFCSRWRASRGEMTVLGQEAGLSLDRAHVTVF